MSAPENQSNSPTGILPLAKAEASRKYKELINLRRSKPIVKYQNKPGLVEIHHIQPVKCGGPDTPENRIALYAKEHFMAHVYLWIIYHDGPYHYQTLCALNSMIRGTLCGNRKSLRDFILQSEEYQIARMEFAKYCKNTIGLKIKGTNNGNYGKHWYKDPNSNKCGSFYDGKQPEGWVRGRYQDNQNHPYPTTGKILLRRTDLSEQRYVTPDEASIMISTGEWEHKALPMSECGKENIRAAAKKKIKNYRIGLTPKNKSKIKYINIDTNQITYFDKSDEIPKNYVLASGNVICCISEKNGSHLYIYKKNQIPAGYTRSRSRSKQYNKRLRRETAYEMKCAYIAETQAMADYFTQYGYEATCLKFPGRSGTCSKEAMLMRFINARQHYGIKFESHKLKGKRKFKQPPA